MVIDDLDHPHYEPAFDHNDHEDQIVQNGPQLDQNHINLITPSIPQNDLKNALNYGPQDKNEVDKNDDPLSFPHEYETMNPLIRDDGKNPSSASSEKLNHKPSNADGASLGTYTSKTTTVKPFNLNPNVNGDNSPTHFSNTFQGIKKAFYLHPVDHKCFSSPYFRFRQIDHQSLRMPTKSCQIFTDAKSK